MKVLVTGAAGFIGSVVSRLLIDRGHKVIGVDCFLPNLYSAEVKRHRFRELISLRAFEGIERDLRLGPITDLLDGVDVVVNEAALPGLMLSWEQTDNYLSCNVLVVQRLLEAMVERPGIRLIHASTSSVYGKEAMGDEKSELRPFSPYGVTKLAAENMISAYRENFDVEYTCLRYFSVYGRSQRPDMAYAIMCQRMLNGKPLSVTGDGSQSRTNTHVEDVAVATALAVESPCLNLSVNISGHQTLSLLDAIAILSSQLGVSPEIEFLPDRPGDQKNTDGNGALAMKLLGWEPVVDVEVGLRDQADYAQVQNSMKFKT